MAAIAGFPVSPSTLGARATTPKASKMDLMMMNGSWEIVVKC
jgi:hypothetical protein